MLNPLNKHNVRKERVKVKGKVLLIGDIGFVRYERKISLFTSICALFESILCSADKQKIYKGGGVGVKMRCVGTCSCLYSLIFRRNLTSFFFSKHVINWWIDINWGEMFSLHIEHILINRNICLQLFTLEFGSIFNQIDCKFNYNL